MWLRAGLKLALRLALGTALALATAELLARHYAFTLPSTEKTWNREGNATSHWRGGIRLPISANGKRILVLGDSYTAAMHVQDDQTFCAWTERDLRAAGKAATLLNAGVPGLSLADYILDGRARIAKERAEWTVVALTADDLGATAWSKAGAHFAWQDSKLVVGRPKVARGTLSGTVQRIRERSAFYQNARLQYWGLRRMAADWRPFRAQPARPRRKERQYPVSEELALAREALGDRVTFLLLAVGEPSGLEAQFVTACATLGLKCVNTREQLEALRRSGVPPQGFPNTDWDVGHLNRWGHRAVAQPLARALEDAVF